jgi:TolA-binding protein
MRFPFLVLICVASSTASAQEPSRCQAWLETGTAAYERANLLQNQHDRLSTDLDRADNSARVRLGQLERQLEQAQARIARVVDQARALGCERETDTLVEAASLTEESVIANREVSQAFDPVTTGSISSSTHPPRD